MNYPSWLEINLDHLDANLALLRQVLHRPGVAKAALCGVVKADAYGLGAVPIAKRLQAGGVDMLTVYSLPQASELIHHGLTLPILILMPIHQIPDDHKLAAAASSGQLHWTIHAPDQLDQFQRIGRSLNTKLPVHLYLDTGMSRGGLTAQQTTDALAQVSSLSHVRLAGLYSHFATAGSDPDFTAVQAERFDEVITDNRSQLPADTLIHLANTAGTLHAAGYHRSMVRVGLGLYGYPPHPITQLEVSAPSSRLRPVLRWLSRIVHLRWVPRGTGVSYGHTYRLEQDSLLGLVPVGHGDGYPVALSNRAMVRVLTPNRQAPVFAPVVGQVSMDQIVINLTAAPGKQAVPGDSASRLIPCPSPSLDQLVAKTVRVGSVVELISDHPASPCALPRLAQQSGSSCYELLCRLSPRLPRCHISTATQTADQPMTSSSGLGYAHQR